MCITNFLKSNSKEFQRTKNKLKCRSSTNEDFVDYGQLCPAFKKLIPEQSLFKPWIIGIIIVGVILLVSIPILIFSVKDYILKSKALKKWNQKWKAANPKIVEIR